MSPSPGRRYTSALLARLVHASVEASAFLYTADGKLLYRHSPPMNYCMILSLSFKICCRAGIRAFTVVHSLAVMWALGPRRTLSIGLQCGLACSAARFAIVLGSTQSQVNYVARRSSHLTNSLYDGVLRLLFCRRARPISVHQLQSVLNIRMSSHNRISNWVYHVPPKHPFYILSVGCSMFPTMPFKMLGTISAASPWKNQSPSVRPLAGASPRSALMTATLAPFALARST